MSLPEVKRYDGTSQGRKGYAIKMGKQFFVRYHLEKRYHAYEKVANFRIANQRAKMWAVGNPLPESALLVPQPEVKVGQNQEVLDALDT